MTHPICKCGHPFALHGDRAVKACEGYVPPKPLRTNVCPCQGYKAK